MPRRCDPIGPCCHHDAIRWWCSGTTGKPKGVDLSHRNFTTNIKGIASSVPDDAISPMRSVAFLPWAHCTSTMTTITTTATAAALCGSTRRTVRQSIHITCAVHFHYMG